MLDNFSVKYNSKNENGQQHRNHYSCGAVAGGDGEISVFYPRQEDDIQCEKENGYGVCKHPTQVYKETHVFMRTFVW